MQEQNQTGAERDRREMIALLNGGDKRELRAFMQVYSKQIYERALEITHDAPRAKDATRRVLAEVAALAARGGLKENIDAQLMAITDQTCSEVVFLDGLVDEAMRSTPRAPAPGADAPGVDAPGVDAPGADAARADMPGADAPGVDAARADMPGVHEWIPSEMRQSWAPAEERRELQPWERSPAPRGVQTVPDLFAEDDGELLPLEDDEAPANMPEDRFLYSDADQADVSGEQPRRPASRRAGRDPDSAGPMLVIAIILASLLVVVLVWILVVKLMADGILPNYDFGFAQWFNTHVFKLY